MQKGFIISSALLLFTTPSLAQDSATFSASDTTITIEADSGYRFIRCIDSFGNAMCEFFAEGEGTMRCVAVDENDTPLAAGTALISMSSIGFGELDASLISKVVCTR